MKKYFVHKRGADEIVFSRSWVKLNCFIDISRSVIGRLGTNDLSAVCRYSKKRGVI